MNAITSRPALRLFLASGLLLLLAACGGSQGFTSTSQAAGQLEIGSVVNGAFTSGALDVSPSTIAPGGTATVTAVLQYSTGAAYTVPTTVNFSSNCVLNKEATITSSVTTNASGEAVATYNAGTGCSGTDTIQATAQVNGSNLIAIGTITISSSSTAVVDAVVPQVDAPPVFISPGTSVRVGFVVRNPQGIPEPGRSVALSVLGGSQSLLSTHFVRSGPGGTVFGMLTVPAVGGSVRVLARLVGRNGPGVGSVSEAFHAAASIRTASLSVVPTVLNLGTLDGRASESLLIVANGSQGTPLADGTEIALRTSRGTLPRSCILRDGQCRVLWKESASTLASEGYGTVAVRARTEEAGSPLRGRAVFAVVGDRVHIHVVSRRPLLGGYSALVSVTSAGGRSLPAGTRLEFRALGGRVAAPRVAVVPNVLAPSGSCPFGADAERGCYTVRVYGRGARLEVLSNAPGGILSERVTDGTPNPRP